MTLRKQNQTNVLIQQNVEDYMVNGPSKLETTNDKFLTDSDSGFVFDIMKVRHIYNMLKGQGCTDSEAWRKSKAKLLPAEEQLRLKRELVEDPLYYKRSSGSRSKTIYSKSLLKDSYWDFTYTEKDIERLSS